MTKDKVGKDINMSRVRVENILQNESLMTSIYAVCVPLLLIADEKRSLLISQENLTLFVVDRLVSLKILNSRWCWVHHTEPETKEWKPPSVPAPKKVKIVSSARKMMVSVYFFGM